MKFINQKTRIVLSSFISTWLICTPAWADDTEIYFGGSTNPEVPPNVLFILDTSTSMDVNDGGSSTRLERMKSALKSILNTSEGINVGLMRFSNPGGPVLFPVTDINGGTGANLLDGSVSARISSGSDDAEQTPNGKVTLNSPWLELTRVPAATTIQIEAQVTSGSDDTEESSTGTMRLDSSDLELTIEGGTNNQKVGVRFTNINIPADAIINDAWLEFSVDPADGGSSLDEVPIEVEIAGQAHSNPPTFSSSASNISVGRTKTAERVRWDIPTTSSASDGDPLTSPPIKTIIQQLVSSDNGWTANNAMVLMIEKTSGDGSRWVKTYEKSTTKAPKLHISYFVDTVASTTVKVANANDDALETSGSVSLTASTSNPFKIGASGSRAAIRFSSVGIPSGATIQDASLKLTVNKSSNKDVTIKIFGESSGNSLALNTTANNLTLRTPTASSVTLALTGTTANNTVSSPDIKNVLQEIINLGSWSENNAMTLLIDRVGGDAQSAIDAYAYNQSSTKAAELTVNYFIGAGSTTPQTVGLRFNDINIPQGATVTSAKVTFTADASNSESTNLVFNAEDADDSSPFTSSPYDLGVTNRPRTGLSVGWNAAAAWTADSQFQSPAAPDLTGVIQEVVNRSGWCGGNSLSLLVSGTGLRVAKSYERSPAQAPRLDITYDVPAAGSIGCTSYPFGVQVNASSDDAEQASDGSVNLGSSDLEFVTDSNSGESNQTIGIRFNDIKLLKGVTVDRAYLELAVDETAPTTVTNLLIKGENVANSDTFTTASNNISSRSTTGGTSWSITDVWTQADEIKRSPDISAIINTIIANTDWAPGNSLSLIISGSGQRIAHAFDGSNLAPRLVFYTNPDNLSESSVTVRQKLNLMVDSLDSKAGTPIVDSLYEAALYYRGDAVDYGKSRGTGNDSEQANTRVSFGNPSPATGEISTYTGGTLVRPAGCTDDNIGTTTCADEEITGSPVYTSPITEDCQSNHIVLLTDGYPSVNTSVTKVQAMTGGSCSGSDDKACGLELLSYLKNVDQHAKDNDQIITTHTIGFNFSDQWLRDLATTGGGGFYEAESASELTSAFDTIIKSIKAVNTTFVQPSVTINQFNRFSHRDDVYFSLFKPQETAKWYGNLKKYQLKGSPATLYDNQNPQQPAIDPLTGFFGINSQSFWSADEDGNLVEKGGAASKIPVSRKVYTNVSSSAVLSVADNAFNESNPLLTKSLLNITAQDDNYRTGLLRWARGLDANGAQRFELGDPLHSRPELVTYNGLSDPLESSIFFGTNEGFLHAVDINTGVEQFSFIPEELLGNLDTYFVNASTAARPYGLDGGITLWTKDANKDGDLKDTGDFAYLYIGMRRGGRNYYALDVTDINNPRLMWQINGGSTGYEALGQTWSRPVKSKVVLNNVQYDVLIFGGGYDSNQDAATVRTADSMGNAVYIVDALTGAKIWSAGNDNTFNESHADMNYGIPSEIQVIDMNQDGIADQLYFGDMGGQIWRFDIYNTDNDSMLNQSVDITKIADLGGSDAASNRRFYYPPDLALAVDDKKRYLSLAIGSGFRAHPLNTAIEDRFYMIKLFDTHAKPSSWITLTEADLYDATENNIGGSDASLKTAAQVALSNTDVNRKQGWYLRMTHSGEKVLSGSTTIQNQIVFTSYQPKTAPAGSCNPIQGTSRAYLASLFDATPIKDIDEDGSITADDRVIQLQIGSIPATPTVIDTMDSKPTVWVGPERLDQVDTDVESTRTYWIEETN
ncbi:MAG: PilC/PilY family type IV pilus protein [Motiliproteus sp.]